MIEHMYMTALSHDGLDVELDLGVIPNRSGTDAGPASRSIQQIGVEIFGANTRAQLTPIEGDLTTEALIGLIVEVLAREAGRQVEFGIDPLVAQQLSDLSQRQTGELWEFARYVAMAPVVPAQNSWPTMASLWTLFTAIGGGAAAGASLGMLFTPLGAVVGAVTGAGSTVLIGASKGAGDAAGKRLGRRILRAGEATDLRSRLDEIEDLANQGRITPVQAEAAKDKALENFASAG